MHDFLQAKFSLCFTYKSNIQYKKLSQNVTNESHNWVVCRCNLLYHLHFYYYTCFLNIQTSFTIILRSTFIYKMFVCYNDKYILSDKSKMTIFDVEVCPERVSQKSLANKVNLIIFIVFRKYGPNLSYHVYVELFNNFNSLLNSHTSPFLTTHKA